MKRIPTISFLFLAAVTLGGITSAGAQSEDRCSLALKVKSEIGQDAISGITGKAISIDAEEIVQGIPDGDTLIFHGLKDQATYTFIVKKEGYNRTINRRFVGCAPQLSGSVVLVHGDPKETFYSGWEHIAAPNLGSIDRGAPSQSGDVGETNSAQPTVPKSVSKGIINGSAISLPKPFYPAEAFAAGAKGAVSVQVTIDEEGNVISATAISGHEMLRSSSVKAARGARFKPTMLAGQPVKVSGIIIYNFQ